MNEMKRVFILIGFVGWMLAGTAGAAEREGLLILVDRSGSMAGEMARVSAGVSQLMRSFPDDQPSGLIHFSGCADSDVVYEPKLAGGNAAAVVSTVNGLKADGLTALTKSLQIAHNYMVKSEFCPKVVLFTDYADTCSDVDAATVIRNTEQFCMEINVITATEDQTVLEYFKRLSAVTKGKVFQAQTTEDMTKAINEIVSRGKQTTRNYSRARAVQKGRVGEGDTTDATGKGGGTAKAKKRETAKATATSKQQQSKGEGKPKGGSK